MPHFVVQIVNYFDRLFKHFYNQFLDPRSQKQFLQSFSSKRKYVVLQQLHNAPIFFFSVVDNLNPKLLKLRHFGPFLKIFVNSGPTDREQTMDHGMATQMHPKFLLVGKVRAILKCQISIVKIKSLRSTFLKNTKLIQGAFMKGK